MEMMAHTVLILVTVNLSLDFSWNCTSALLLSQFFSSHLFSFLLLCLSKSFLRLLDGARFFILCCQF